MPRTIFEAATLKLTGYYLLIIMLVCLVFSVAVYHFADRGLRYSLSQQSQRIADEYPGFDFTRALHSQRDYEAGAHRILINLLYFNIVVLGVAGVASYGLAKRTLSPIRESHEQQQRFTADVSHELRTPLTALTMASEVALLDKAASKATLRAALEDNLVEAKKLDELISNLLRLTRLEVAELQASFDTVPLSTVLASIIDMETARAKKQKIRIENAIEADLAVQGDTASLTQLFTILLDNALKYSPADSTIRITSQKTDKEAGITIADEGMGIAEADLPHIFERFYRADSARTRSETSGYGLGLSIAKLIADAHDGIIRITSTPKKGTTVQVLLPRQKA
jgi:signal transduction histidine kinase